MFVMKPSWLMCVYFFIAIAFIGSSLEISSLVDTRRVGNGHIAEALSLGQSANTTRDDCIWRVDTDACSRTAVKFTLHTMRSASAEITCDEEVGKKGCSETSQVENIDLSSPVWLHSSNWNPSHETVVLVHGYGGFSDTLPTGVLKQAYLQNGTYNIIVVDWGGLAKLPCYIAAVHNMRAAAKCLAELFVFLRNSGVDMRRTTCVGQSLGAHVCGITSNFLNFRLHKIIGVDPAKPLVPNNSKGKLDVADAEMVQVLHTSSNYGDAKKSGHVDFYFNGGRIQPFCSHTSDQELCSHTRSVCFLAESIFSSTVRYATKCRRRNVEIEEDPKGIFNRGNNPYLVPIGQTTPTGTLGTYCVSSPEAPFCSKDEKTPGHPLCCKTTTNVNPLPVLCCQDDDVAIDRSQQSNIIKKNV